MKKYYIRDIAKNLNCLNSEIIIYGWIQQLREFKTIYFGILEDSTDCIRIAISKELVSFSLKNEQSIKIEGVVTFDKRNNLQIEARRIELIGDISVNYSPRPRSMKSIFEYTKSNQIEYNKHIYIRNNIIRQMLIARAHVMDSIREWFKTEGYIEVTAPILTPILLYDDSTGIDVHIKEQDLFLTQCVGFYLESAVHSLERVYNIGPSFRKNESVSRRHLMEYWHVKSEVAFCNLSEMCSIVENMISYIVGSLDNDIGYKLANDIGTDLNLDGINIPFIKVEYRDALKILEINGIHIDFGKNINEKGLTILSQYYNGPFWLMHKPKTIEGFPYKISKEDNRLTQTADLIASNGKGEILGVAEKITDTNELINRIYEKNKNPEDYKWFIELRQYGSVPHCGMGMGVERLIRWIFSMPHVKDVIPFPRRINKRIYP